MQRNKIPSKISMKNDKLILKSQVRCTGTGSQNNFAGEDGEVWGGEGASNFQISRHCKVIIQTVPDSTSESGTRLVEIKH